PKDSIGLQPPKATIIWGKRDAEADPQDSIGLHTPAISWGKRQDITEIPVLPGPTPTDEISMNPPEATVSWGKRDDDADSQDSIGLQFPTYSFNWPKPPKSTSKVAISWGKREAEPATNSFGLGKPTRSIKWPKPPKTTAKSTSSAGYISWGKREAEPATDSIGLQFPTRSIKW
ncbi:hypothetical protein P154DRAFT_393598, partial [Amniculicola lignicola CBS 123094]